MQHQKQKKLLLSSIISLAILVHLTALYMVHGLTLHSYEQSLAFIERHRSASESTPKSIGEKKEEVLRKNEQLAQAFKESRRSNSQSSPAQFDLKKISSEFIQAPLLNSETSLPSLDNPINQSMPSFELDDRLTAAVPLQGPPEESLLSIPITAVDLVFPEEKNLSEDLIQAAHAKQGSIEMSSLETLLTANGLKIGKQETPSPLLTEESSENRTGFIDIGIIETPIGSLPKIFTSSEFHSSEPDLIDASSLQSGISANHAFLNTQEQTAPFPIHSEESKIEGEENELATIAGSHDFVLEIDYTPIRDSSGYLFCIKLVPKKDVSFKRIRQNLFFLIDRSHSINSQRYEATVAAVLQGLKELHQEDTFNILIFDNKIVRMSEKNLPWNSTSLEHARQFLSQQKHGGMLATTDLYSSLGDIVPDVVPDTEVNTAILFSDGDTYLNKDNQRKTIGKWTKQNAGKVSLFSIAAGTDNDLALLDLLSSFNKGSLYFTPHYAQIESSLKTLLHSIQNPIGKNIAVNVITSDDLHQIAVYPRSSRLPDLYEQTPYVIYGNTNELTDFYLFLQGKYYDKWFDIKQTVSFKNAKKVSRQALEKEWALQQAYDAYDQYLKSGKPSLLIQAHQLLSPYKIPIAFQ